MATSHARIINPHPMPTRAKAGIAAGLTMHAATDRAVPARYRAVMSMGK